jgi:hypothetical protein
MTKIYKAYVYQDDRGFTGEIDGININTNIIELANTPIEFYADSKKELLAEMVKFLKSTGRTGVLRIANKSNDWVYNAPYNPQFLGAQPARVGEDY